MQPGRKSQTGFTFMELLVVGAVILIVLAVAVPAYDDYSARSDEQRAIADLADLDIRLTRWEVANARYPIDLAEAGLSGMVDPWGNRYQYLRIDDAVPDAIRTDARLRPLNTDYDLYSFGPDGQSTSRLSAHNSRDDIVRANNGSFIDVARALD